ncbi:MAG: bifunctional phosphoribosylaminoimidazolecarboxamide formyltransferase/IMP cyclohydrolase, partial [Candidatus Sumerlaeaceae bacterium]|nr:bifunctional phosphoribosylaminoimidazolecarboxamide formyltransferase/IMP cyclohydrolase [Candidatus Sumerlaeaceae bacterium]
MARIETALISVYRKHGLVEFAQELAKRRVTILSTGGTLRTLLDHGIPAVSVADYTGQAEILGGRVKTLHPKIFGGILARRNNPEDLATLEREGIRLIDLVVVSLYPFEETVAQPNVLPSEAIEQIDIGGVALLRAAAKNHDSVYVVCEETDYHEIINIMDSCAEEHASELRRRLAFKAFQKTAAYDAAIANYLSRFAGNEGKTLEFPAQFTLSVPKIQDLRYGENPHQRAAFYSNNAFGETSIASARQLHGKELSYNNIIDLDSALEIVRVIAEPCCAIIKHNNPCGVARAEQLCDAFRAARACDPVSAFGGVIGFNRAVDAETAEAMADLFVEAIVAPEYTEEALSLLTKKKNLRLLATGSFSPIREQLMLRSVVGGILVQTRDTAMVTRDQLRVVTKAQPTEDDLDALLFAWKIAKFVKSNAIVYTSRNATIGIGAGQMSRIDSTNIAAVKAQSPVRGAYMASDAFFPFRDNVDRAADIGIRAIIQPGGSVRDAEVIEAADEHGLITVSYTHL